jgi:hypothetical protein
MIEATEVREAHVPEVREAQVSEAPVREAVTWSSFIRRVFAWPSPRGSMTLACMTRAAVPVPIG